MPGAPPTSQPTTHGGVLGFFLLAFGFTWALQLPAAIASLFDRTDTAAELMPLAGLGVFGPTVAAVLVARRSGGVRALLRPLWSIRVGLGWLVLALGLSGVILVVSMAVHALVTGDMSHEWIYPPRDPERVVALLLIPLAEEIGWRGLAYPRLERAHGPLRACAILGLLWALWHAPMFAIAGVLDFMLVMLVFMTAGSVVFTWLYRRTGGSLLVVVLAHAGAHLNNSHLPLPADPLPVYAHTVGFAILALVLFLTDRQTFGASVQTPP